MLARTLALAALCTLVLAADASGCKCAYGDPRDRMAAARSAFVGTVAERRAEPGERVRYVFDVERVLKGRVPERVEGVSQPACGVDLKVGERAAFGRFGDGDEVSLCGRFELDELDRATRPYPVPAGRGRLALLVPGALGDGSAAGYDASGRLLGYVFGPRGRALSVCPGSRFAVQAEDALAVIRLRDLSVVSQRPLPGDGVTAVRCLAADGRDAVAHAIPYGPADRPGWLVRARGARLRTLARPRGEHALLGPRAAVHTRRGRIEVRPYDGGLRVVRVRGEVESPALSPDGTRLAYLTGANRRHRLALQPLRGGGRRSVVIRGYAAPAWLDAGRVALVGGRGRIPLFRAPSLTRNGSLAGGIDSRAATSGGRLYGFAGRHIAVTGAAGTRRLARALTSDSPQVVPVPGAPRIDAPPRRASPTGQRHSNQGRTSSSCSSRPTAGFSAGG